MLKKWNRLLAVILAFALVTTTFGSDIASTRAFAVESDEELAQLENEIQTAEWEQIPQEGEEQAQEEQPQEETVPEEVTEVTDQAAEESGAAGEDAATTVATTAAEATTESSTEEVATDASTESSSEDAATNASSEEVVEEAATAATSEAVVEEKLVTVRYKATKGGRVSSNKETVDINDKDSKFEGSTATAWNDKYTFVDWTDANGNQVSTDATFVPSGIEEDAEFTANFVAAEDISETMPSIEANEVHAGGLIVSVQAEEGLFPAGTELKISAISDEQAVATAEETLGKEVNKAKGVDISFVFEGNEIQPANNKYVHVKLDIEETIATENLTVLHDHGDDVEKIDASVSSNSQGNAEAVEFDSNQFSVFIVVEEGTDARLAVKFMNGNDEIVTLNVKENDLNPGSGETASHFNDIIYDPGVGNLGDGVMFRGWTTDAAYTTLTPALTIDDIREQIRAKLNNGVTEGDKLIYYAMLFKAYTVSYIDDLGASLGSSEVLFRADEPAEYQKYTIDMQFTPADNEHKFEGWLVSQGKDVVKGYTEGKSYPVDTEIEIKGNVILSVDLPAGHWLVFNENGKGATYNAPQFVKSGFTTQQPCDNSEMVRNGYTFGGWYYGTEVKDDDGNVTVELGQEFEFGGTLSDLTTIYAKWEAVTNADYTILIWKQNLDGTGYDFATSVTLNGTVNSSINAVQVRGTGDNSYVRINGNDYNEYTGFHYDSNDQSGKTIAPEGTTVVNVYYKRNEHTLTFQVDGVYIISEGDYDNNPEKYGVVNGQHVRVYWNDGSFWRTRTWSLGGYRYSHKYEGTVYTYSNGWTTIKEIKALYGQSISDQFPIVGTDGITYNAARWKPQSSTPYTQVLSYIDIMPNANVTFHKDDDGPGPGNYKTITYYVEALPGTTEQTYSFNGKTFVEYKSLECDYRFFTEAEDYIDLPGYTKFGYDPSTNTWGSGGAKVVKCYYTRNKYEINFMDGAYYDGNNNRISSETSSGQIELVGDIYYQANVKSYDEYKPSVTRTGYVFEGWYVDDACTSKYEFDKMPEGGITVYARWRQIQYRVFLHSMADGDNTLDWGSATQQTNFRVSYGGKVSTPSGRRNGYEFAGWSTDPEGKNGFNKDAFVLNDQTVTAEYDKTKDFTDPSDKWGNANATTNSDITGNNGEDRFWITRKLDLYANWRETTTGAKGIGLIYDANGGSPAPTDTNLYADKAMASAGAAPTTTPAITEDGNTYESRFSHWVVQKWDSAQSKFVDTTTTVLPGATFKVLKADARVEDAPGMTNGVPNKTYTVQLRAEYVKVEKPVPTHITFYNNYDGGVYASYDPLEVNKEVPIYGLGEGETIPSRKGYKFLGWAREVEVVDGEVQTTTESETLWIGYDAERGYYYDPAANNKSVQKVAADEKQPYHALYAVWEKLPTYTVTYEITGDAHGAVAPTDEDEYLEGDTVQVLSVETIPAGYTFEGWTSDDIEGTISDTFEMPAKNVKLVGYFKARDDVEYTVEHYFQTLENEEVYEIDSTYTTTGNKGTTDTELSAETLAGFVKTVDGFEYVEGRNRYFAGEDELDAAIVQGDGSLVVKLYYNRKSFKVTYSYTNDPVPAGATDLPGEAEYKYGETVTLAADATAPGYDFSGWTPEGVEAENNSFQMPAKDVEVKGTFTARDDVEYTVEHYFQTLEDEEVYEIDSTYTTTGNKGTTDAELSAETLAGLVKTVDGFEYVEGGNRYFAGEDELDAAIVQGDGSLVVKLYYSRKSFKVTYRYTNNPVPAGATELPTEAEYKYGDTVTAADKAEAPGYT
ncbi:InlB B-repeat-containing protein, partial [Butyrivibrio sp. INlla14]|uniref:InlB B-repeat-containing protein n=1 Tax=Butyrivibrio sp. INlla14 TaxID=1520808 RepID=UPI0008768214